MLFPTIDFAIFFAVAFTVNWLLNPYAGWWKLAMIGLSYVFYGWVGWSYCLLLFATTAVAFVGGNADGGDAQRPRPAHRHDRHRRRAARDLGVVQVLRVRVGEPRQRHPHPRNGPARPAAPGGAADRDLVLHLHGDQLRDRHLPQQARAGQAARLRGVPVLLPPPAGRPDRARDRAAAPDPAAA